MKVYPQEVVQVLESFPLVAEAAVVGVKDAMGEEAVFAAVTLRAPATEQEILAFCRERLAEHKVPRRVAIRRELPRGPTGKVRISRELFSP